MREQIEKQENLLLNLYLPHQNMPYYLHGVCIHDGTAESGHYYSYIRDHKKEVWRLYNDHRVCEVEEEKVFEEANGGSLTKSAYYVIYISEKELQNSR